MNKRHYEHTLPNIRGSLSNTYNFATKNDMATSNRKRSRKSRGETIRSGFGDMKDLSVH